MIREPRPVDMSGSCIPLQELPPACFRATVHGTVFCERGRQVARLNPGDDLLLLPDPPSEEPSAVWVHHPDGDVIGHLPPEIGALLAPWMRSGGRATAKALRVGGDEVPSWRRLLIEVRCSGGAFVGMGAG